MIRRGFWLAAGAMTGIYGYRRVSAAGRRLSASLTPGTSSKASLTGGTSRGTSLTSGARTGVLRLARETYRFTRDVREGMELYRIAHSAPAGSAFSAGRPPHRPAGGPPHRPTGQTTDRDAQPEDGR